MHIEKKIILIVASLVIFITSLGVTFKVSEDGKEYFFFKVKDYGSVLKVLKLNIGDIESKQYLYCHLVEEPYDVKNHKFNIVSNKVVIKP